ncbi:MAG: hypothetical protein JXA41_12825 [Deltaproteobacteria bacterium]|nr:hypothetical protein [Deltaproteobacteria bacterium]
MEGAALRKLHVKLSQALRIDVQKNDAGMGCGKRPAGQSDRRERLTGAMETATAVSMGRAQKGALIRPERSGTRMTATVEEGRHARVTPTKDKEMIAHRPLSPTPGGDRGRAGESVKKPGFRASE